MWDIGAVVLLNKAPSLQNWNMKYYKSVEFCQFSECHALLHKRKAPLLKTYWTIHWNIYESVQSFIIQPVSLLGFNMAQSWKSLLWPGCGKWNGQHIAAILVVSLTILAHHGLCLTLETMQLLKCSEISKINSVAITELLWWRLQSRSLWPMQSVHQGLQGSYFSIRYLFFQNLINQMYALGYRVNFIWNVILMNSMK